jgi:hypothetical protein
MIKCCLRSQKMQKIEQEYRHVITDIKQNNAVYFLHETIICVVRERGL